MRAADVVGRKIVKVYQKRRPTRGEYSDDHPDKHTNWTWSVERFELDNGSMVWLDATETDWEPIVEVSVRKRPRKTKEVIDESRD